MCALRRYYHFQVRATEDYRAGQQGKNGVVPTKTRVQEKVTQPDALRSVRI